MQKVSVLVGPLPLCSPPSDVSRFVCPPGTPSAPSQFYAVSPSCDDESYLDDSSFLTSEWRCRQCPIGGNCKGPRKWNQVGVQFGYFRLHEADRDLLRPVETSFWRCFKPLACLGSKNPKMEGRYFSELVNESRTYTVNGSWSVHEIDLAATDIEPERCNQGTTKEVLFGHVGHISCVSPPCP